MKFLVELMERGLLPDKLVRMGIRQLLRHRLWKERSRGANRQASAEFVSQLEHAPIAKSPEKANQQHYELPAAFFCSVLGSHLKYSGCYWPKGARTLDQSEEAMLELTCERAQLEDGMEILELGCGWGSLTLWMAEHFPNCRILAMSNSKGQRRYIQKLGRQRGLGNIQVESCDINDFQTARRFDRIVSVEMFEHLHNFSRLFSRLSLWLKPAGKAFVHIFCHKYLAYPFQTEGSTNWMGQFFFTGGIMPSADLFSNFDRDIRVERQWWMPGTHYARTAAAWLANLDRQVEIVKPILDSVYQEESERWLKRWRIFFMACEELFGYRQGREWGISHYRFLRSRGGA